MSRTRAARTGTSISASGDRTASPAGRRDVEPFGHVAFIDALSEYDSR